MDIHITDNVKKLPGVGAKAVEVMDSLGIETVGDLLRHIPINYTWYPRPVEVDRMQTGKNVAAFVIPNSKAVKANVKDLSNFKNGVPYKMTFRGNYSDLSCVWSSFISKRTKKSCNQAWFLKVGEPYILYGEAKDGLNYGSYNMFAPQIFSPEEYAKLSGTCTPVYRKKGSMTTDKWIKAIEPCISCIPELESPCTDAAFMRKFHVMPFHEALKEVHQPTSKDKLAKAQNSLKLLELYGYLEKVYQKAEHGPAPVIKPSSIQPPFPLTGASSPDSLGQKEVLREIYRDLASGTQMNRLVQGDVGCGKTIVAFLAICAAVESGYQAVLMAPSEVLARQEYAELTKLLQDNRKIYLPELLLGKTGKRDRRRILQEVKEGTCRILVGTHAVLSEDLDFHKLGLVVTDEQHKFGVEQRSKLVKEQNGMNPHVLSMSATPIPRTVGNVLYGNMSLSLIKEKPAGRKRVLNTYVQKAWQRQAWNKIAAEVAAGHQAYIICPMVDDNEKLESVSTYADKLLAAFPHLRVETLHGKVSKKDEIMERFKNGETDVLISTTVIEVGVNVPNATVILIENAERFGLAQLHQLRGRVGRGDAQGYCIFMQGNGNEEKEGLSFIATTNDGFEVAEKDFELRGQGDILGNEQSGRFKMSFSDFYKDFELVEKIVGYMKEK